MDYNFNVISIDKGLNIFKSKLLLMKEIKFAKGI